MADKSAFNIQHIQQEALITERGLLEHLNLPPSAIRYIRKNMKTIQIALGVLAVLVVGMSVYSSYQGVRAEKASAALAAAMQQSGVDKNKALTAVAADFSGTPSARWARIEMAHGLMQEGKFKEAADGYTAVKKQVRSSSPMIGLLTAALAGAYESDGNFEAALSEYKSLQKMAGYEELSFTGLARVHEAQGDKKQALADLEEYLVTLGAQPHDPRKAGIDEKIARLKARM